MNIQKVTNLVNSTSKNLSTMNRKYFKLLPTILFLLVTTLLYAQSEPKALLCKVSGNGLTEPSYLFGTFHLLGSKYLDEVKEVNEPLKNAKGVVVEMVFDSSKMMTMVMMTMMTNNKISNLISSEDYKIVSEELQKASGYSLKLFDSFKPMQATLLLSISRMKKLNEEALDKYTGTPLDFHISNTAKSAGKTITQLESMEEQIKMIFDHQSVEEQAKNLVTSAKGGESLMKSYVDMFNLYLKKDLDGLYKLMETSPEEFDMDYLVKNRNENWVKKLPEMMASGSQFIAVGAGHLPGESGLIKLLRKKGYSVEGVTR
jgi:uncharacterized protein